MPPRSYVRCPDCKSQIKLDPDDHSNVTICPYCETRIRKKTGEPRRRRKEAAPEEHTLETVSSRLWLPLLLCFAWFFLGIPLALLVPWFGAASPSVVLLYGIPQMLLTLVGIVWSVITAVQFVRRSGELLVALPFSIVQLVLFPLLLFQVACFLGTHHFESDRPPTAIDWIAFSFLHAFNAFDLTDSLQAFGFQPAHVRQRSILTSVIVAFYRITLDLFLLALLWQVWKWKVRGTRNSSANDDEVVFRWNAIRYKMSMGWLSLAGVFLLFYAWAAFFSGWSLIDVLLWWADCLLRVVDAPDLMELTGASLNPLHGVVQGVLAVLLRLLLAAGLLGALVGFFAKEISIRWLDGFGMDQDDLREVAHQHPDPDVQEWALQRIDDLHQRLPEEEYALRPHLWMSGLAWIWVFTAAGLSVLLSLMLSNSERPRRWLTARALEADAAAVPARHALERMGIYAEKSVPEIAESLPAMQPETRQQWFQTLVYLGPRGGAAIVPYLTDPDEKTALSAVKALALAQPQQTSALLSAFRSKHEAVRQAADRAIRKAGRLGAQSILDGLTDENYYAAIYYLPLLDSHWRQLHSDNPKAEQAKTVVSELETLRDRRSTSYALASAADYLSTQGNKAIDAIPDLIALLERDRSDFPLRLPDRLQNPPWDWDVHGRAFRAIVRLAGLPRVEKLVTDPNFRGNRQELQRRINEYKEELRKEAEKKGLVH